MSSKKHLLPCDLREALAHRHPIATPFGTFAVNSTPHHTHPQVPIFLRSPHGLFGTLAIAPYTAPLCHEIDGIPVYLPVMKRYGCWDAKRTETLYLYPHGTTWQDITHNIVYYTSFLDAPEPHTFADARYRINLSEFTFIPNNLHEQVEVADTLPMCEREQRLTELIATYKPFITSYPPCPELLHVYTAYIEMQKALAQTILRNRPNATYEAIAHEIIACYKSCIPVLKAYRSLERMPDGNTLIVLILLAFWYSDTNRPKQALYYAQQYLVYEPAGTAVYHELKHMIHNRSPKQHTTKHETQLNA